MASAVDVQVVPQGRSRPPDVKFWEDFVLYGMPSRDLVLYYTDCTDDQYWDMNVFLMTQLLTAVKCCGRCVWSFTRLARAHQHQPGCDWSHIAQTVQQNLILAFPWMKSKRSSIFWHVRIVPDYIKAQARCLENKWAHLDSVLNPDRKEITLCLSHGASPRKPSYRTYVSLLELVDGDLPTVNPDGTLKLAAVSMSAIMQRLPYSTAGQLQHADPFWNLEPVSSDEHIRSAIQSEYDAGHDVFYFHLASPPPEAPSY